MSRLMHLGGELVVAPGEPRRKFDLAHMRALLAELGNPQTRFPSILIAGTNGKGSTAATLASILAASGYVPGLYTSPHLTRVNERIQLGSRGAGSIDAPVIIGQPDTTETSDTPGRAGTAERAPVPLDDATLFAHLARVEAASAHLVEQGALPATPSFFETLTALAMLAFAEPPHGAPPVDIAILEVGMGGRLDATNVVEPLFSIITDISLDHTEWLGPTITAIAREKAGILRVGGTMITLPQHPEANQALGEVAVALGVRGVNAADFLPGRETPSTGAGSYDILVDGEPLIVDSPLHGQHQQRNIALAIAAAQELRNNHGYNISNRQIQQGIHDTHWPGRLERLRIPGRAEIVLDVAHNPAGAWALRAALNQPDDEQVTITPVRRVLIFGCMRDKALSEIAQILFPIFDHVILTELASPRSASSAVLAAAAERTGADYTVADGPAAALDTAFSLTGASDLVVASGSVLLIGALRSALVP